MARAGWLNQLLNPLGLGLDGGIYGLGGIVLAHCYFNGAFAARQLLLQLEAIPAQKRKLAHCLSLSGWRRFRVLEWPALAGSVPVLACTIFLLCFTSFSIVLVLGGSPRYNTLEVAIYEALKLDFDPPRAVALALLQLLVCAVLVLLASGARGRSNAVAAGETPRWPETPLARACQWATVIAGSTLLVVPLLTVLWDGLQADLPRLLANAALQRAALTSLAVASASSALVVAIALAVVMAQVALSAPLQLGGPRWARALRAAVGFSATLYLALPSLVLGLGFFLVARQLPGQLQDWAWVALVVANVLMALPFALALLLPPAHKASERYDALALSLALRGWRRWCALEWPLLRRAIGQVAALSFCLSLGDMGVIALFGNAEISTLPWLLYQNFGSYRSRDAAGIALILLAITLFVFWWLPKLFYRERHHA